MRVGWHGTDKFCRICPFFARNRLAFQSGIIGAAASGLEARVLTHDREKKLDAEAVRHASAPRQGIAIYRQLNEEGKEERWEVTTTRAEAVGGAKKALNSSFVGPVTTELSLAAPGRRAQELAAVFGKVAFENAEAQQFSRAPVCPVEVTP